MKQIKFSLKAIAAAALLATTAAGTASAQSLSDVVAKIREDSTALNAENQRRLREFQSARDAQAQELAAARSEVRSLEARGQQLKAQFDANEAQIEELSQELLNKSGEFAELVGQFNTAVGEIDPLLRASFINMEDGGIRVNALSSVAQSRSLPTRQELDILWKAMLTEVVGQAEVKSFDAVVSNMNNGEPTSIMRIGPFTAFTNEASPKFLELQAGRLKEFGAQPSGAIMSGAKKLISAGEGQVVAAPVDPSQGDLLGLLADMPDLGSRIEQGGLPGYVVLFLLAVGLLIGVAKLVALFLTGGAVAKTAQTKQAGSSNPLARIFQAYEDSKQDDVEALELRLDEAILKETPKLERGVNIIKVLAAVAPLLGLLGTVVGMIRTFTQITLVGTGDPKTMADGISQALVTTVEGLIAAIPLILVHAIVSSQAKGVQQVLEEQAAGMVAERAEQGGAQG